jgi:hypothetical protein
MPLCQLEDPVDTDAVLETAEPSAQQASGRVGRTVCPTLIARRAGERGSSIMPSCRTFRGRVCSPEEVEDEPEVALSIHALNGPAVAESGNEEAERGEDDESRSE